MTTKLRLTMIAAAFAATIVAATPVFAHHSFAAEFDANKPVKLGDGQPERADAAGLVA